MKSLIIISSFLLTWSSSTGNDLASMNTLGNVKNAFSAVCPSPNNDNKSLIEEFLTESDWSSERKETKTDSLSVSQITTLTESRHASICKALNNTYQEMLNKEHGGEQAYNVSYYKVGGFYFVVISIRQSSDPNIITTGVEYLDVYNQNLDLIQGYAF